MEIFNFLIGLIVVVAVIATAYGIFYNHPKDPPDYFDRG